MAKKTTPTLDASPTDPEAEASSTGSSSATSSGELAPDEAARAVLEGTTQPATEGTPVVEPLRDRVEEWRNELRPIVNSVNFALGSPITDEDLVDENGDIRWALPAHKVEGVVLSAAEVAAARGWEPRTSVGSLIGLGFQLLDHFAPRYKLWRESQPEPPAAQPNDAPVAVAPDAPIRTVSPEGVPHE